MTAREKTLFEKLMSLQADIAATAIDPSVGENLGEPSKYEEPLGILEPLEQQFYCFIQKRSDDIRKMYANLQMQEQLTDEQWKFQAELDSYFHVFWLSVAERFAPLYPDIWRRLQSQQPLVRKGWQFTLYDFERQMTERVMQLVQEQGEQIPDDAPETPPTSPRNKRNLN